MPILKYKMCLPRRLRKNKKDEFCRFNEEHSLIGSGFIQILGLTVFEQVSLKVFKVCRAVSIRQMDCVVVWNEAKVSKSQR